MRIEKLRVEHGVNIEWVHFPLHPETPPEGQSLEDLFRGRNVDRKAMHAAMKERMTAEGLPYGDRTMTYNSRLAQELGKWADTQPRGEAIHDALFRAYFVEARDIPEETASRRCATEEVTDKTGPGPGHSRTRRSGVCEKRRLRSERHDMRRSAER